jgi:hypothetical protein
MTEEYNENLNGAIQHLLGRRQIAEAHGGKPLTATTSSVSSHCQSISYTAGKRWRRVEREKEKNTHNNPWRMTSGRSVFEPCLGWRASYLRSTGVTLVLKNPVVEAA